MKQRAQVIIKPKGMSKGSFKAYKRVQRENLAKEREDQKKERNLLLFFPERSYLNMFEWVKFCLENNFIRGTIYHRIGNHYYYNSDRVGMEKTVELH